MQEIWPLMSFQTRGNWSFKEAIQKQRRDISNFPGTESDVTGASFCSGLGWPSHSPSTADAWQGPRGPSPGTDLEATRFLPFSLLSSLTRPATPAPLYFRARTTRVTHEETSTPGDQRCYSGSVGGPNTLFPLPCWVLLVGGGRDLETGSGRAGLRAVANRRWRLNGSGPLSACGGGGFFRPAAG